MRNVRRIVTGLNVGNRTGQYLYNDTQPSCT